MKEMKVREKFRLKQERTLIGGGSKTNDDWVVVPAGSVVECIGFEDGLGLAQVRYMDIDFFENVTMLESDLIVGCKFCGHVTVRCSDPRAIDACLHYQESQLNKKPETINHPQHYGGDTTYEVIKVMEAWMTPEEFRAALLFNVHKYCARYKHKGGLEDLKKAQFYLNKCVEKFQ